MLTRFLLLIALAAYALAAPLPGVRHVVVIGYDGLSPNGIAISNTPAIDSLRAGGAFTWHARGVMPTISSPNWASMIMGAGPEQHGVTSNEWKPDKFDIPPTVKGTGGTFPTVFGLLREQRPAAVIGVFHDWKDFGRLVESGVPDMMVNPKGPEETVRQAIAFLRERKPALTFIHLDHVDHAGHEYGHGGPEYKAAVEEADRLTATVVNALKEAGMFGETVLLLTADHGGTGKKHGGNSMAELEIPWIIHGPVIARGRELKSPVNTYDTAATIAHILGLKRPAAWIGRPVLEAFK